MKLYIGVVSKAHLVTDFQFIRSGIGCQISVGSGGLVLSAYGLESLLIVITRTNKV